MQNLTRIILLSTIVFGLPSVAHLSHRAGVQVGGLHFLMGYTISAGALYQMAFHRNFALELDGNYNFGLLSLGQGPTHSGGVDASFQTMIYNFGSKDFSKGFGFGVGSGIHYLADYNENLYFDRDGSSSRKGTFLRFPLNVEIFYQHLFDNDWFIKTGLKASMVQLVHQLDGKVIKPTSAPVRLPGLYFMVGYSFM